VRIDDFVLDAKFEWFAALLLLPAAFTGASDKVIMKRDLEIRARNPNLAGSFATSEVPGGEISMSAYAPAKFGAGDYYDAFYPTCLSAAARRQADVW